MKKFIKIIILILGIIIIGFLLQHFISSNDKDIERVVEKSSLYSEEDIQEAIHIAINQNPYGVKLEKVWYDESYNLEEHKHYEKEYSVNEVIIIRIDFYSGSGKYTGLEPNTHYTDEEYVLGRESKNSKWRIITWGEA